MTLKDRYLYWRKKTFPATKDDVAARHLESMARIEQMESSLLSAINEKARVRAPNTQNNGKIFHPDAQIDALVRLGFGEEKIICSAGQSGYFVDTNGYYWKCGSITAIAPPIGNIFEDQQFRRAESIECDRYPTALHDFGVSDIQCWCWENKVMPLSAICSRFSEFGSKSFLHISISNTCNYSCDYCTIPDSVFNNRRDFKDRTTAGAGYEKPFMSEEESSLIANAIVSQFENVNVRLAGVMEPLLSPGIDKMLEIFAAHLEKIDRIVLMSNIGMRNRFLSALRAGAPLGKKLKIIVSMHILDKQFKPERIAELMNYAMSAGHDVDSHIIPAPEAVPYLSDYLDFFSIHGVRVRLVPFIAVDAHGRVLDKHTHEPNEAPKSFAAVRAFLDGRDKQEIERARDLNRDTYEKIEGSKFFTLG